MNYVEAQKPIADYLKNKFFKGEDMTKCCKDKTTEEVAENVIRPDHYKGGEIEPIDYIMSHKMTFPQGNVVKYVSRYKRKGSPLDDLKKARQYLDWLIEEETKRIAAGGGEAHG